MSTVRPYPGLRPFTEIEQAYFFGREGDKAILIDKILANRLTLLFAASGVGKSSLLRAAVIPQLTHPAGEHLSVVYHRRWWGEEDMSAVLCQAILQELTTQHILTEADRAELQHESLVAVLGYVSLLTRAPLVLILDQFEEFFRYQRGRKTFSALIEALTDVIVDKTLPVSVVLSMREDFALELNAFKPRLPTLLFENFYRLEKLDREAARLAIVRPVEPLGFRYEKDLVDQLLNDLAQQVREVSATERLLQVDHTVVEPPYLQIVCERLWQLAQDDPERVVRLRHYQQVGGVTGILEQFLRRVLAGFSGGEQALLSQAFDYLVAQRGAKMAWPLDKLAKSLRVKPERLQRVLERLTTDQVRVLLREEREGVLWYELYHDMFSESIERWNNEWKARQLKRQRWTIRGLVAVGVVVTAFLADSFYWLYNNSHFPVSYLFQQHKFRLMDWGLVPEALPEMESISASKGEEELGELNAAFAEDYIPWLKERGSYSSQNFAYPTIKARFEGFEAGRYEVTYEQYDYYVWQQQRSGVAREKSDYPTGANHDNARGTRAVTQVSWDEAVAYTEWLSEKTGDHYRLPTEAEWEYAARAGAKSAYPWGDEAKGLKKANCANCGSEWDNKRIAPVGSFDPNPWGIYDMAGNVWEWTCVPWQDDFGVERATRCANESDDTRRVLRGGSWNDNSDWLRFSARYWFSSNNRSNNVGFRVFKFPRQDSPPP